MSAEQMSGEQTPLSQPHPSAGLSFAKTEIEKAEPLRLELEDFLRAVQQPQQTARYRRSRPRCAWHSPWKINAQIAAAFQTSRPRLSALV